MLETFSNQTYPSNFVRVGQQSGLSLLKLKNSKSENPLLFYLPGMDGTGKLLSKQVDNLSAYFDCRCVVLPKNDTSRGWQELCSEVISLIKQELQSNLSRKRERDSETSERLVYLCGESFGGCLALLVAAEAPHLFERLILVNAASSFNQRPILSWGEKITRWVPPFVHNSSNLILLPFLAALHRISEPQHQALLAAMKSVPQSTVVWRLSLLRQFALSEQKLRGINCNTLIIAGAKDRLLPSVNEAKRLAKFISLSEIEILPESGHACLLEQNVNLSEILDKYDFLDFKASD